MTFTALVNADESVIFRLKYAMSGIPTPYTPPSDSSRETCTGAPVGFGDGELLCRVAADAAGCPPPPPDEHAAAANTRTAAPTTPRMRALPPLMLATLPRRAPLRQRDSCDPFVPNAWQSPPGAQAARRVSTVISLGAKIRSGGPQKPVPRLV
ncbi:hypothetical protein GCM10022220_12030 [Actinocatenispora rupis]|uniref:Uncharacterized protein n=1 Tax=Actinocatenispora rupis TaxID=519421 RepID=A0A8J3NAQ3_9ACTN|nr:hypothetical protein Aru02nite_06910 [Actinocatenispora rupis]